MKLKTYLDEKRGRAAKLAAALGVTPTTVSEWASNKTPVAAERCPQIEKLTNRAVTCEELREDLAAEWAYLRSTAAVHCAEQAKTNVQEVA